MIRRARLVCVLAALVAGATGTIAATQTWVTVVLADGTEPLLVPGASALPVLTPLSLAVLALGGALSIVGTVLRYVFGALALIIAAVLGWTVGTIAFTVPLTSVSSTVTEATGIAGATALADLVSTATPTPWPAVTLVAQVVLAAGALVTLATAGRWRGGAGRRFRTAAPSGEAGSRPHDAIDSWDDLSRGADPTA